MSEGRQAMDGRFMWDPWQEMRRLQREMEHLVASVPALHWPLRGEYPPLNVMRDENGIVVEALFPGVDRASLGVTVVGGALTIHGQRNAEPGVPEERYRRRERPLGTFTRTVSVGERLDGDTAQATYTNGILRVQLARADAAPKKIAIHS
jgi:HSP20 family protein